MARFPAASTGAGHAAPPSTGASAAAALPCPAMRRAMALGLLVLACGSEADGSPASGATGGTAGAGGAGPLRCPPTFPASFEVLPDPECGLPDVARHGGDQCTASGPTVYDDCTGVGSVHCAAGELSARWDGYRWTVTLELPDTTCTHWRVVETP